MARWLAGTYRIAEDVIEAEAVFDTMLRASDAHGTAFVIVTHDLTTLFTICGRIAVLVDNGTASAARASGEPTMTASAPQARALQTSPPLLIPPSVMMGT